MSTLAGGSTEQRQGGRQVAGRQTDRQAGRQTDRERERDPDRTGGLDRHAFVAHTGLHRTAASARDRCKGGSVSSRALCLHVTPPSEHPPRSPETPSRPPNLQHLPWTHSRPLCPNPELHLRAFKDEKRNTNEPHNTHTHTQEHEQEHKREQEQEHERTSLTVSSWGGGGGIREFGKPYIIP